jgi:hypothetical protein
VKDLRSHTFYITLPLAFIFSFYCWNHLASNARWRQFAKIFLAMGILFQAGYAYRTYLDHTSVYSQTREKIAQALQANDYRLLDQRRPDTLY